MLLGICVILACAALVISTAADRVLSRLGVNRWIALLILAAVLGLSMVGRISITDRFGFNLGAGAAVVLLCLVLLMFIRGMGKLRALLTMLIVGGGVYLISAVMPWNWDLSPFDLKHVLGLFAGIAAAALADQRRSAVFASVMGLYAGLLVKFIIDGIDGYSVWMVGEGVEFAAMTIAAVVGILLADLIWLVREHRGGRSVRRRSMPKLKVR